MAELNIRLPDGRRQQFRLQRAAILIGRDGTCDLVLNDPACSRRHLRIHSPKTGQYVLEDLGSHNGTSVNGERVVMRDLVHGDEIRLGRCLLRFSNPPTVSQPTVVLSDDDGDTRSVSVYRESPTSQSRLDQLLDLSSRLIGAFERRDLLERAMDICMETLHFDRGLIVELRERKGEWQLPVARNLRVGPDAGELTVSRSTLRHAIEHGERSIINEATASTTDVTESMVENRICSAMCVPITWQDEILGAIYGDRITTGQEYVQQDVDFLAGLAAQIGAALKTSQMVKDVQVRQQLDYELTVARQIQEGLFPKPFSPRPDLQIVAYNSPGRSVSGDYYDVIEIDDDRVGIIIADVSGKGVPAAMLMANLQAAVRITLPATDDLVRTVQRLNQLVYDNTSGSKFITCLLGVVDMAGRTLRYVNAGHYPPYWLLPNGTVRSMPLDADLPLGVARDTEYALVEAPFGDDASSMFCYTDGIPEALNKDDEFFGLARIEQLLKRSADAAPGDLIDRCRKTIAEFVGHRPQGDDITLMAMRIGPASARL